MCKNDSLEDNVDKKLQDSLDGLRGIITKYVDAANLGTMWARHALRK